MRSAFAREKTKADGSFSSLPLKGEGFAHSDCSARNRLARSFCGRAQIPFPAFLSILPLLSHPRRKGWKCPDRYVIIFE